MLVLCGQGVQKTLRKGEAWAVVQAVVCSSLFALETLSIHPAAEGSHGVCGTCQEQQAEVFSGWLDCP